jgi:uncharacterized protein (DUF1330 family)
MPVYAIAQGRTVNRAMHDDYVAKALPTLTRYGAKILAVTETPDVIEGTVEDPRFVLLEFPSRERFRAWYASPEYQAIVHLRLESVPGTFVLIDGRA